MVLRKLILMLLSVGLLKAAEAGPTIEEIDADISTKALEKSFEGAKEAVEALPKELQSQGRNIVKALHQEVNALPPLNFALHYPGPFTGTESAADLVDHMSVLFSSLQELPSDCDFSIETEIKTFLRVMRNWNDFLHLLENNNKPRIFSKTRHAFSSFLKTYLSKFDQREIPYFADPFLTD